MVEQRGRRWWLAGVLASVLAGCAAAPPPPPTSIEVVKPTASTPFDRTFSWRPVDGASTYHVVVYNGAGDRTFEVRDLKTAGVAVAKDVWLAPGPYSWQVRAFKDGQQLLESPLTKFEIK
jgi:hypothetical protein